MQPNCFEGQEKVCAFVRIVPLFELHRSDVMATIRTFVHEQCLPREPGTSHVQKAKSPCCPSPR